MVNKMSYNLQKRLVAFFVLLGVVLMVFPCIRVYAEVDISTALTTARALTDQEVEDFQQAADELIAAYQNFAGSYVGDLTTVLKSHLKFVESLGLLVLEPVSGVFYYLADGVLTIDDTNHSGGGGIHNSNSDSHGGGSNRRVESSDDIAMSGEDFKSVLDRLNNQYAPSQLKDQFISSYQTLRIIKKDGEKFMYFPLRYGSDMIFGQGYDDLYLLPFVSDGSASYFSSNQLHVYHELVNDVPHIYIDVCDISTGSVSSSLALPLLLNTTSIPFVKLNFTQWSTYPNKLYFHVFADNLCFLNYDVRGQYRESGLDLCGKFIIASDLNSSYSFYQLYSSSSFTPQSDVIDDYGFYCSTSAYTWDDMFSSYGSLIKNINDGDVITYSGDTINEYVITNKAGDSTTINNYITNNYIYPDSGGSDDSGGGTVNNNWNIEFPDFIANISNSISTSINTTFNLLFVPSDGFIDTKMSEVQDLITLKIPFVHDFDDIFKSIFVELDEDNTLYSSFDNDKSQALNYPCWDFTIDYFGKKIHLVMLDFSTFGPYLGSVRLCVFVFVYVLYIYRLWKYLPVLLGNVANVGAIGYTSVNSILDKGDDEK